MTRNTEMLCDDATTAGVANRERLYETDKDLCMDLKKKINGRHATTALRTSDRTALRNRQKSTVKHSTTALRTERLYETDKNL